MPNAKLKCKFCKKWFPRSDLVRSGMSSYCSDDCQTQDFFKPKEGKDTFGTSGESKPTAAVVEAVRIADGNRCRVCGKSGDLITHHIYYRSEPDAAPFLHQKHNLISLHNLPCHLRIIHGHKRRFKPLLLGLIWLRDVKGDSSMTVYQLEDKLNENRRKPPTRYNWGLE